MTPAANNGERTQESESTSARDHTDVQKLVARAIEGDHWAFSQLYSLFAPQLTRRLYVLVFDRSEVDDLLQATFLEVYRNLAKFRPDASFAAWLHGICFNVARAHLRSKRRKRWLRFTQDETRDPVAELLALDPEADVDTKRAARRAAAAISELAVDKRAAFVLFEIERLGLREISELLGVSEKTIWSRVQSAKKEVQRQLKRRGD